VSPAPGGPSGLRAHLRKLLSHAAIYGAADVFTNVISFLLIPLFTRVLSTSEYGVLAVLLLFGTVAKIVFRLGLDGAFFRVHYDQTTETERRRLAGTVALFAAGFGTLLFLAVVLARGPLTRSLFRQSTPPELFVVLVAADIYLGLFAFVPLNLLRIQDRPGLFSALSTARHALNLALKVVLVLQGFGVAGVLWSDVIATGAFSLVLAPVLCRNARWALSAPLLREVLGFGLPKVPHGVMVQVQNLADRWILEGFVSLGQIGIYQVGYTMGTAVKFALSAFEPAWQPFLYSQIHTPDAPRMLARLATYAFAAFVTVGLGVAVMGRELVMLMTTSDFHGAAPLVPVVTLAYVLHGVFLLGSVGIGIEKRTRYYPLITAASATTNVVANLVLIPRVGILGAAWATVLSYAVMAGLGVWLSFRLYPIPFEISRLLRIAGAAGLTYSLSWLSPENLWAAMVVKSLWLLAFPALLWMSGALRPAEREWLLERWRRRRADG
jgi:O-antigen/teichoic acid export membrane protein